MTSNVSSHSSSSPLCQWFEFKVFDTQLIFDLEILRCLLQVKKNKILDRLLAFSDFLVSNFRKVSLWKFFDLGSFDFATYIQTMITILKNTQKYCIYFQPVKFVYCICHTAFSPMQPMSLYIWFEFLQSSCLSGIYSHFPSLVP